MEKNEIEENNMDNYARVVLKKSSSTGKVGYDIDVKNSGGLTQEELTELAQKALTTAIKVQSDLDNRC